MTRAIRRERTEKAKRHTSKLLAWMFPVIAYDPAVIGKLSNGTFFGSSHPNPRKPQPVYWD